jgi:hypothetical protein
MRAPKPGNVIELDRQHMMALIQTDAELGEILTRAFILRRVELIAAGIVDVVHVGSTHSSGTLRIKEFLMRNGHSYSYIDVELDPDVQKLLECLCQKKSGSLKPWHGSKFDMRTGKVTRSPANRPEPTMKQEPFDQNSALDRLIKLNRCLNV